MRYLVLTLGFLLVMAPGVWAAVTGSEVTYSDGEQQLKGYLAYDDAASGKRPGVLVVHEWWGHNGYARNRARMLAKLGYVALAVDMYGDGRQADHPDQAGAMASAVSKNMAVARKRFAAGLELLRDYPATDPERIAAIGYCFGGGIVLQMAREGLDLQGVVSFHGSLATTRPAEKGAVKAAVLVCNGAEDPLTTQEQIAAFMAEMTVAGVRWQFHSYPGAKHGFTNPDADRLGAKFSLPVAYNAEADRHSWQDMHCFLRQIFAE